MDEFKDSMVESMVSKATEHIESAELLLETEDRKSAIMHIKACKKIIKEMSPSIEKRKELEVKCRGCHARIFESAGKYLPASYNYFEISKYSIKNTLDEIILKELSNALSNATKCAILGKACVARDEILKKLYQDTRSQNLFAFKMLQNMHQNRIIPKKDQDDFGKTLPLKDQIKLIEKEDITVLQKATIEHNMRCIAKLYKNICIKDLSILLSISMDSAEDMARNMVLEKRLDAVIDQIDNEITFNHKENTLISWDTQIKQALLELNKTVEMIQELDSNRIESEL